MTADCSTTRQRRPENRGRPPSVVLCTANQPGAIAIIELIGDVEPVLAALTGRNDWPVGRMRLTQFGDIDEGLAARLDIHLAQLMPHGGPRVVQRLMQRLIDLGCNVADDTSVEPTDLYPEAADEIESLMLHALARAHSPLAIDLLLDQPRRWRSLPSPTGRGAGGEGSGEASTRRDVKQSPATEIASEDPPPVPLPEREGESGNPPPSPLPEREGELIERSRRLSRLIDPPLVVLAGPANVGKSTLSNSLLGRSMSIAFDQPGTTRDYTTGLIDLGGLVVRWFDTPGLRETTDEIEQRAIELARSVMEHADLLIAITDHEHDPPTLPRTPDLLIANKCDLVARTDADLNISATNGTGIATLVARTRDLLVPPEDLQHPGPWLFDDRLIQIRIGRNE